MINKTRSTPYPGLTLSSALKIAIEARKLGKEITKETLAGVGRTDAKGSINSGAFLTKLAALSQYGLIKIEGNRISFTKLAEDIIYFDNEPAKKQRTIEAFLSPETFNKLYVEVEKNQPIKVLQLRNKVQKELGITSVAIDKFIKNFIESGKFAETISVDSDIDDSITLLTTEINSVAETMDTPKTDYTSTPPLTIKLSPVLNQKWENKNSEVSFEIKTSFPISAATYTQIGTIIGEIAKLSKELTNHNEEHNTSSE